MRRIYAGALSLGFMFAGVAAHAATDSETGTFSVGVDSICEFITTKSTTAGGNITDWDVDASVESTDMSTATVVFRLVTNTDTKLTGSFANGRSDGNAQTAALLNTSTDEVLLTYANIQTDGAAATTPSLGIDGHNAQADIAHTGFASGVYDLGHGVGVLASLASYTYIGGLATVTSSGAEPADSADSAYYDEASASTFLDGATGVQVTHVDHDGAALVTVNVRGFNGEDFGLTADYTEAPDPGTYTTVLTLTALNL